MGFDAFMDVVLYDPAVGYYRRAAPRVGRAPGTDFFTASSSPLFGTLVAGAAAALLDDDPAVYRFVEIGAEPGGGVLAGKKHPFREALTIRVGEPLTIEGPAVVFSNELFDAQPFRRFRFQDGVWRELGVRLEETGVSEAVIETTLPDALKAGAGEGYVLDVPLRSAALAAQIARQPWQGLFLAFDYGRSWEELCHGYPEGTARAYRDHKQVQDLLEAPSEQDLTCHICWDWIRDALGAEGFAHATLESQEAFLVKHCGAMLAQISAAEAGRLSRDKLSMLQLLHPAHMGRKFQALWALRKTPHPRQEG